MRLVMIEWEDSHAMSADRWMHMDESVTTEPRIIHSVGWLHASDKRSKILVPHRNEASPTNYMQGAGVISIPTRCVVRMVDLKEAKGRRANRSA